MGKTSSLKKNLSFQVCKTFKTLFLSDQSLRNKNKCNPPDLDLTGTNGSLLYLQKNDDPGQLTFVLASAGGDLVRAAQGAKGNFFT